MGRNHGNGGSVSTKVDKGTTILESYGKDQSDYNGPASKERIGKFGGGMSDLSHSLTGASANQGKSGSNPMT